MPIFVRSERPVFGVFLVNFCLQHATHFWKAYASAVNFGHQETILVHPTGRQTFAGNCSELSATPETLSYTYYICLCLNLCV